MPSRRKFRNFMTGVGGAASGVKDFLDYKRRKTEQEQERQFQILTTSLPTRLNAALDVSQGKLTPDQFQALNDALQNYAQSQGGSLPEFDLNPYKPTPTQATSGIREDIFGAKTPEDVPDMDELLARVQSLPNGPELAAPVPGKVPNPATDLLPEGGGPQTLPGMFTQPVQPDIMKSLGQAAESKKTGLMGDIESAHKRELGFKLGDEEAIARQGEKLNAEFEPAAAGRALARARATATDPQIRQAGIEDQAKLARLTEKIKLEFEPRAQKTQSWVSPKTGYYLVDPRDGHLIEFIPPGKQGFMVYDRESQPIAFIPGTIPSLYGDIDLSGLDLGALTGGGGPNVPPPDNDAELMRLLEEAKKIR